MDWFIYCITETKKLLCNTNLNSNMNSSEPFLSIIITAYNVGKYIESSLLSAINQTYEDIEIIVVDDGSTDDTAAIVKSYSLQDKRIKYYHQTNSGIAATRNFSLSLTQGLFFTFLDGDDLISKDFAQTVFNNHESNDLLIFDFLEENASGSLKEKYFDTNMLGSYKNSFTDKAFLIADKCPSLWAKAYRTEFIKNNQIEFYDTKTLEDMLFVLDILMCKPALTYVPFLSYTYKYNAISLSRKINISVLNDRQKAVSFYLAKYSAVEIPENNYFFTFWFNRIFMQLFLVFSSKLVDEDRKIAFFQTIDFIHPLLEKFKTSQLVKSNKEMLRQLNTFQLKLIFTVYMMLYSASKLSKSLGYILFKITSLFFKMLVNK